MCIQHYAGERVYFMKKISITKFMHELPHKFLIHFHIINLNERRGMKSCLVREEMIFV